MSRSPGAVAIAIALALLASACSTRSIWLTDWSTGRWSSQGPALLESADPELEAPQQLVASSGELRAIPLKWEPVLVGRVAGYLVERAATREGPFERLAQVSGRLNTRYVDAETVPPAGPSDEPTAAPEDGVTWFYRVRTFSESGQPAVSASSITTATTAPPPGAPEDLRAYSRQPRQVPLSWSASEDPLVHGYRVERSPTARGPFELVAELEGRHETTYIDVGLGDLRVFYYRVIATNSRGGLGSPTDPVQAVTKPEPLPPVKLHAAEQRLGINVLAWEPNVEADIVEYRVLRTRAGADRAAVVAVVPGDSSRVEDRAVGAGETMDYSIVAIDRDGLESSPAEPIRVVGEGYRLEASVEPGGVRLHWDGRAEEGYHGGHVFRQGLFQWRDLGFSAEDGFLDTSVEPGRRYRYSVVLETPDRQVAPRSQSLEVAVPEAAPDA